MADDKNKANAPMQGDGKAQSNMPVQSQTIAPPKPVPAIEDGEEITYLPAAGDPASIKWRGVEFKANVPKRITDKAHIEAARVNRFFRVGKGDPSKPADHNPNDGPKTPMEYRAHVVAWIKTCENVEDVVKHWSDDRVLRQTCEVGSDDIQWLGTIVEPKLMDFRRKEGLSEAAIANVWIKYGVLDLPWRG